MSLNESVIKVTNSQHMNLVDYAASVEPISDTKENYNFFLENFNSKILNLTLSLITRLYSFENLNRKNVNEIINEIFISICVKVLRC